MKSPATAPIPSTREALRFVGRLILLIRPYWMPMSKGLSIGLVIGLFGMITPLLSKEFIDRVYPRKDFALMHVLIVGIVVVSVSSSLIGVLRGYYSQVIAARLSSVMSLMYLNHLQHLPAKFFDDHRVGEVLSRFGDLRGALGKLSSVFQTIVVSEIYVLLVPPFLLFFNWKLALVAVMLLPVTTTISTLSGRITRKYWKQSAELSAEFGAFQFELFSHIRMFKTLGIEYSIYRRAENEITAAQNAQLKATAIGTLVGLFNGLLKTANTAVFSWYAWTLILKGELTLGSFFAFSSYLGYLTGPVNQFAGIFVGFQRNSVTLGRAFEYLDERPEQAPSGAYTPPSPITHVIDGDITLERVSFGYSENRYVLKELDLTIPRHSVTAIVGSSGAGKSSILKLIGRVMEPARGRITFGGRSARDIPLIDLRRQIAIVWQDVSLTRGTVWENLTFGIDDVARRDVEQAIAVSHLDDLIKELPHGYDSPIAEWGASVSGGQRQRFAIARALIRQTPILLLDEATSQIDVNTESALLSDLLVFCRRKTVVMVTHRIATAAFADQICIVNDGRIEGVGDHSQLLDESANYARMASSSGYDAGVRALSTVPRR